MKNNTPHRKYRTQRFTSSDIVTLASISATHNLAGSCAPPIPISSFSSEIFNSVSLAYGPIKGRSELRTVIANLAGIHPDEVLVVPGASFGLALIALCTVQKGDEAIIIRPGYPPAKDVLKSCGAKITEHSLEFKTGYRLDVAQIERLLSPTVRLISLANPHIPSGISIPNGEFAKLLEAVRLRAPNALMVVDETFREGCIDGPCQPSLSGLDQQVVTVGTLSKAYGAPGLRMGWVCSSDPRLFDNLTRAKANLFHSCSSIDEAIAFDLINRRETILAQQQNLLKERMTQVERWAAEHVDVLDWIRPDAGAVVSMRFRELDSNTSLLPELLDAMQRQNVAMAHGPIFGDEALVFRLGFGFTSHAALADALDALSRAIREVFPRPAPNGECESAEVITRKLVDLSLPASEWTHEAHLKVCLWLLRQQSTEQVIKELPGIICRYNESVGTPNSDHTGYHATITGFYVRQLSHFLDLYDKGQPFSALESLLLSHSQARKDHPLNFYSHDRLFSVAARRAFLEPDLRRLD